MVTSCYIENSSFYSSETSSLEQLSLSAALQTHELHRAFDKFFEDDVNTYKHISLCTRVYLSLLQNIEGYNHVLSTSEQNLVFGDIKALGYVYKHYILRFIDTLVGLSLPKAQLSPRGKCWIRLDINQLICSSDIEQFDLGSLINDELFGNPTYKLLIVRYSRKLDFIKNILAYKSNTYEPVRAWLAESKRLVLSHTKYSTLESLLEAPLNRLYQYPSQLKRILDLSSHKYSMSMSLIKVNKVCDIIYHTPNIQSWEDLRDHNKLQGIELKKPIPKQIVRIDKRDVPVPFQPYLEQIKRTHTHLQSLALEMNHFTKRLRGFTLLQIGAAQCWNLVLGGNEYFDVIYYRYSQRIHRLESLTEKMCISINRRIIFLINLCISYLKHAIESLKNWKPLQNHTQMLVELATLSSLLNTFILGLTDEFNQILIRWLQPFAGSRDPKLQAKALPHNDVVQECIRQWAES